MNQLIKLKVTEIWDETPDTCGILLEVSDGKVTEFKPGQFLTLLFDIDGKEVRRGYSIFTHPDDLPSIGLAVKKIRDGNFSRQITEIIRKNSDIKAIGPAGTFTVDASPEKKRDIVLIGAGSGITPLMSMLTSVLKDEPLSRVMLLYGNRSENDIIFRGKLDELKNQYGDRFTLVYSLTDPPENWRGSKGRIRSDKLNYHLNKWKFSPTPETEFYLCGPEEMMKDVSGYLIGSGIDRNKIFTEYYKISVSDSELNGEDISRKVTIIRNDDKHEITVEPGNSILQTALENNIELPNSCQYGSCGSCKAKLISGKIKLVDQRALTDEELEEGYCLTCVGYPASDNVVVYYE